MLWLLVFLVLIAAAFGVLGLVIKATIVIVLTIVSVVLVFAMLIVFALKRQARRFETELERRLQPPRRDDRY